MPHLRIRSHPCELPQAWRVKSTPASTRMIVQGRATISGSPRSPIILVGPPYCRVAERVEEKRHHPSNGSKKCHVGGTVRKPRDCAQWCACIDHLRQTSRTPSDRPRRGRWQGRCRGHLLQRANRPSRSKRRGSRGQLRPKGAMQAETSLPSFRGPHQNL